MSQIKGINADEKDSEHVNPQLYSGTFYEIIEGHNTGDVFYVSYVRTPEGIPCNYFGPCFRGWDWAHFIEKNCKFKECGGTLRLQSDTTVLR